MRIRKLELQGFKSFADRATFHFGPGISAVVGPNGCGKSNVVDATRWCIGEQSAKSLRGDSMSDVIFAGSSTRQAVGFAEVALTFVAGAEPFPGIWQRFEELEVSRRLYRDGASEYLVNQEKVRLRDIQDLFLDTGVGNRLYSFIEQGRIGQIVQARPEQRRTLIEEAAGISRYKLRRDESMEKLASTRLTLERVADLTEEMARQLRSVERQVQRSLRARTIGARVRQEELVVALARFGGLVADRKALSDQFRKAEAELEEATRGMARLEEELTARRAALESIELDANRVRDRLAEVEAQRRVEESAAQYQSRETEQARERLARLAIDQEEQRQERDVAQAEADLRGEAGRVAERELSEARGALDTQSAALREAYAAAVSAREKLEVQKRAANGALEASVRAKAALDGIEARRVELDARERRLKDAQAAIVPGRAEEELARQQKAVAAAEVALAEAQKAAARALGEVRREAETAVQAAKAGRDARVAAVKVEEDQRLAELRSTWDARVASVRGEGEARLREERLAREAAVATVRADGVAAVEAVRTAVEARVATAKQALAAAEEALAGGKGQRERAAATLLGADQALQAVVREREKLSARVDALHDMDRRHVDAPDGVKKALAVPGVKGTLADEVDVPPELEDALARALDGGLDTVLVGDREVAARVVVAAKGSRLRLLVNDGDGTPTGLAAEVRASEAGRSALARLLPAGALVDGFAEALAAWSPGRIVVTRDGAVIRADGVIQLGSETGTGVIALQRRRELAELTKRRDGLPLDDRQAEVTAAKTALALVESAQSQARAALDTARAALVAVQEEARQVLAGAQDRARVALREVEDEARAAIATVDESARRNLAAVQEEARTRTAHAQEAGRAALAHVQEAGRAAVVQAEDDARSRIATLEQAHRELVRTEESMLAEARHRMREAEAERQRHVRSVDALAAEERSIDTLRKATSADESRVREQIRAADEALDVAEAAVRVEQVVLETVEPALKTAEDAVAGLRLAVQGHQKDAIAHQEAAAGARARAERATLRSQQIERERTDLERRLTELQLESAGTAERLQQLGEEQGVVHTQLEALKERLRDERDRVRISEAAARAARERRDVARDRQVAAESRLAEVRGTIERLREQTESKHETSLPALLDRLDRDGQLLVEGYDADEGALELGAEPVPTLRITADVTRLDDAELADRASRLQALQDQLAKLGEYNPEAEGEYREVSQRHRELETQRRDLEEAMDIIEKAIAKINKTCRERFRETFDLVNEQFSKLYPRLVGGGSGRLELTDEEDLLTTGVELLVQPPGKRVQNLSLLSGGEKAMAALGLIFALFRIKPSPFCLLDEVDAPLDEGNGARFNDMLREMSQHSQFIVITHNKKTMECADVLYGVTMPEPGASRLVTVKLD